MVFNVRCFKCGEEGVRLVLGGRAILHARCQSCDSNLLAEVMALEEEVLAKVEAVTNCLQEDEATDPLDGGFDHKDDPRDARASSLVR